MYFKNIFLSEKEIHAANDIKNLTKDRWNLALNESKLLWLAVTIFCERVLEIQKIRRKDLRKKVMQNEKIRFLSHNAVEKKLIFSTLSEKTCLRTNVHENVLQFTLPAWILQLCTLFPTFTSVLNLQDCHVTCNSSSQFQMNIKVF